MFDSTETKRQAGHTHVLAYGQPDGAILGNGFAILCDLVTTLQGRQRRELTVMSEVAIHCGWCDTGRS